MLAGRDAATTHRLGERYAERVLTTRLRPEMLVRLRAHQARGHRTVIVSASPTIYLDAVGRRLGVEAVLATELEVDDDGRLTGALTGANCRRAEKVQRLESWMRDVGCPTARVVAYGDSRGDRELLARADEAVRV